MKKLSLFLLTILLAVVLVACGSSNDEEEKETGDNDTEEQQATNNEDADEEVELVELIVGASNVPHAEILEEAAPLLKEKGIDLVIETYQDYVFPNEDLDSGTLDANFYQHIPYFENQIEEIGYDFVNLGEIHLEPMGIYSKNINSVDDISEGTVVIISRSISDHGRILSLLENEGLIKLDETVDPVSATVNDIVENPLNLEFDDSVDPGFLPEFYEREVDALVAINTNYALEADLVPTEDALILETSESPYVNIVAARSEDKDNEQLKALVEVLQSEEIQTLILEKYEGSVLPAADH